jgi:hypothetical protein
MTEAERQRAEAQRLEAKAAKLDPNHVNPDDGAALRRDDDSDDATPGVRQDDRAGDRQYGTYRDRRDDTAT